MQRFGGGDVLDEGAVVHHDGAIQLQRLRYWARRAEAPPGAQDDPQAGLLGGDDRLPHGVPQFTVGIEQGAVDVQGEQAIGHGGRAYRANVSAQACMNRSAASPTRCSTPNETRTKGRLAAANPGA